tara:strand:+ start:200 stop:748 length:549 start_codon:yes stop_codon:yes gene_type:complete
MAFVPGLIAHPRIYCAVAEGNDRILGSNILDERSTIRGIGPITVNPETQSRFAGTDADELGRVHPVIDPAGVLEEGLGDFVDQRGQHNVDEGVAVLGKAGEAGRVAPPKDLVVLTGNARAGAVLGAFVGQLVPEGLGGRGIEEALDDKTAVRCQDLKDDVLPGGGRNALQCHGGSPPTFSPA